MEQILKEDIQIANETTYNVKKNFSNNLYVLATSRLIRKEKGEVR